MAADVKTLCSSGGILIHCQENWNVSDLVLKMPDY
jgi:hypothetical protein